VDSWRTFFGFLLLREVTAAAIDASTRDDGVSSLLIECPVAVAALAEGCVLVSFFFFGRPIRLVLVEEAMPFFFLDLVI
jgi:hypothetical protein